MNRFDRRGMLVIPNPFHKRGPREDQVVVLKEAYCPEGHNLVSDRAYFNGEPGIILRVRQGAREGHVALSPIFGEKSRVSMDIDLIAGEILELFCPRCGAALPTHSTCHCGGDLVSLFLSADMDFADSVAVCNRVDCVNSKLIRGGQLLSESEVARLK